MLKPLFNFSDGNYHFFLKSGPNGVCFIVVPSLFNLRLHFVKSNIAKTDVVVVEQFLLISFTCGRLDQYAIQTSGQPGKRLFLHKTPAERKDRTAPTRTI
jgi:hypothetical protein